MPTKSLTALDLNLLVALDAILREGSVTKASARLGLSQPAVSVALRRLRIHFADELLTRDGNTWRLTPIAESLRDNTESALDAVKGVFLNDKPFDPAESSREFTIHGSDHIAATVGVSTTRLAFADAPNIDFRFRIQPAATAEEALEILQHSDAALMTHGALPGLPSIDVIKDHWVYLASTKNTRIGEELTLEQLSEVPFVVTHHTRSSPRPAIAQLAMLGVDIKIATSVDSFLALPWFVEDTDCVALVPSRIAPRMIENKNLRILACPYEAVRLTVSLYWHPRHTEDPAHQWMRRVVRTAGLLASDDEGRAQLSA
jgi:LysR family transcriptional regulator, nod-box dependent transcriptional activator